VEVEAVSKISNFEIAALKNAVLQDLFNNQLGY
jgi:hypothetical protein